jgi:hypothetical protein
VKLPKGLPDPNENLDPPLRPEEKLAPPNPNSLNIFEKSNPLKMSSCEYRW